MRVRITASAAVVVGAALIVGALAFYWVLSSSIRDATARSTEARAEELAARVAVQGWGEVSILDDEIVQVLDATGRPVAQSDDADEGSLPCRETPAVIDYDEEPLLVVCQSLGDGTAVAVGASLDDDHGALATVAVLLALSVLVVVMIVSIVVWWVVDRSLQPVSSIRAQVDRITADRLDRRVPVPSSGDEVAALAVTMNRMLDRLDAAAAAQRRFISDASHELKSPLATIRQHAELAQTHPDKTSVGDLAAVVHDEGLRLQDLVDSLLLLARLDEQAPLIRQHVDLDDVALAEVSRLRAAGIAVDAAGIGPARVLGDPRLLGQLARNLADNAARHARSRVAISVTQVDGWALLTVDDDGTGVPAPDRERVFERFLRLDDARARDAGGSGLGLAIVRSIAAAEGGAAFVDISPLGGARFQVNLPAAS